MILHLLRMRRNVNRNVFNGRKNVSATPSLCWELMLPTCGNLENVIDKTGIVCVGAAVVVPDSTSPGFVRIWDRDGSGPRFVPSQDSHLLLT